MLIKYRSPKSRFVMARLLEVPGFLKEGFKFTSKYLVGMREVISINTDKQEVLTKVTPKPVQDLATGQAPEVFEPFEEVLALRLVIAGLTSGEYYESVGPVIENWEDEALRLTTYSKESND